MKILLLLLISVSAFGQDFSAIAEQAAAQTDQTLGLTACRCDVTIPASAWYIDKDKSVNPNAYVMDLKPGMTVCFANGIRGVIEFHNVNGMAGAPITFASCGGTTLKGSGGQHVVQFFNSSFVRVSGEQGPIDITGGGHGLYFTSLSSYVGAYNIDFHDLGYAGFEAKTDPTCDQKTWRGAFTLYYPTVENCRFRNLGGEAIYIGESHYNTVGSIQGGPCASGVITAQEHDVIGAKVTGCTFEHIGRDAIQIGASTGTVITNNKIHDFGYTKESRDGNAITWNPGNSGEIAYNIIDSGFGFGILLQGRGSGNIHHNIVSRSGLGGIMLAAYTPIDLAGYEVYNNTLYGVTRVGLEYYSQFNPKNNIINVLTGGQLIKKGGTITVAIPSSNIQVLGDPSLLKLDASYTPLIGSLAYRATGDAGAIQAVRPPVIIKEAARAELVIENGIESWYLISDSGKRKKIE